MRRSDAQHRRRVLSVFIAVATALAIPFAGAVGAQEDVVTVPLDTVVRADEGSVTSLFSGSIPEEFRGLDCTAEATSSNQGSVHPGNDLIIETGDSQIVIAGVEDAPGAVLAGSGPVVLGEALSVSLSMGPDEVFSGGIVVSLDCTPAETTTTVAETTTTVAATETTVAAEPETTEAAPTTVSSDAGQSEQPDELPNTGPSSTMVLVAFGVGLAATGLVFLRWERKAQAA